MTRKEAERLLHLENTLMGLGFTRDEATQLRRISMTLHRWAEAECNGEIERNPDDSDKPYRSFAALGGRHYAYRIADREIGAIKRLRAIIGARNRERAERILYTDNPGAMGDVTYYVQGDPRGCALYIIRPGDVPEGADVNSYYYRGIAVY